MRNLDFNISRFLRLCTLPVQYYKNSLKTACLTALVVLLLLPFGSVYSVFTYGLFLYVVGFIVTSQVFSDLNLPVTPNSLLLLPCSNLERFLSRYLLVSFGLITATMILFLLYSVVALELKRLIFVDITERHDLTFIQTSNPLIIDFLILQPLLVWGSLTFKKNPVMKNIMMLGLYWLLSIVIFAAAEHWLLLSIVDIYISPTVIEILRPLSRSGFLFLLIVSPLLLWRSYQKLCERRQ